jgi:predicted ATP-grasp superfamily ATP-dependent carboligase
MQRLTIELTGNDSLKVIQDLEDKQIIRIVENSDMNSSVFSGHEFSPAELQQWIDYAENSPTVPLSEAKYRWSTQKTKLQNLIR